LTFFSFLSRITKKSCFIQTCRGIRAQFWKIQYYEKTNTQHKYYFKKGASFSDSRQNEENEEKSSFLLNTDTRCHTGAAFRIYFKLSGRQARTGKKSIFLVKKMSKNSDFGPKNDQK